LLDPLRAEGEEKADLEEGEKAQARKKYVQIKQSSYSIEGMERRLIQFIDISNSILYDQEHAKSELLALINVTVSHEMRNPLNSILSLHTDLGYILQ